MRKSDQEKLVDRFTLMVFVWIPMLALMFFDLSSRMTRLFMIVCFGICYAATPSFAVELDGVLYDAIQIRPVSSPKSSPRVRSAGNKCVKPMFNKVDPAEEESPELRTAWDEWHRRVAQLIFQKYSTMADAEFKDAKPLRAHASYIVSKDGCIIEARITQSSRSAKFNTLVITAINAAAGNVILRFPADSHRNYVEKSSEFTMNAGMQADFDPHPSEWQNPPAVKPLVK